MKAFKKEGLMCLVQSFLARTAMLSDSSFDLDLNCLEHKILCHPSESNPDGPADPDVLLAQD